MSPNNNVEKEIFGWFPDEHKIILERIIDEFNIKSVTEIGSFLGKSTVFFASKGLKVNAIDPFVEWEEGKNNKEAVEEGWRDQAPRNPGNRPDLSGVRC